MAADQAFAWYDDVASEDEKPSSTFKLFPNESDVGFGDVELWPNRPVTRWAGTQLGALRFKIELLSQKMYRNKFSKRGDLSRQLKGFQIIRLANAVFGVNGWSSLITSVETRKCEVEESRLHVIIEVTLRVTLKDGTFNTGAGVGEGKFPLGGTGVKGSAFQRCRKEAVTNALKNCILTFGEDLMDRDVEKDVEFYGKPEP